MRVREKEEERERERETGRDDMPPTLLNNMTREIKQSPGTHVRT